jgi:hypothetical protein
MSSVRIRLLEHRRKLQTLRFAHLRFVFAGCCQFTSAAAGFRAADTDR